MTDEQTETLANQLEMMTLIRRLSMRESKTLELLAKLAQDVEQLRFRIEKLEVKPRELYQGGII